MYDNDVIFIRVRITLIIIYIFVWNPADDLNTSFIGSLATCVYGPPLTQPIFMMHGVTWTEKTKEKHLIMEKRGTIQQGGESQNST